MVSCSSVSSPISEIQEPLKSTVVVTTPTEEMPYANGRLSYECVSMTSSISSKIEGSVIAVQDGYSPFLLNLETGKKRYLGEVYLTVSASPDYNRLAYIDWDKSQLIIVTATGETVKTISVADDWRRTLGWLDSENLLIEKFRTPKGKMFIPSSTIVLNVADGKYQEYLPDYPDILPSYLYNALHWQQYSTVLTVYSPTTPLYAVYPAQSGNETPIILLNASNQREITRIHTEGYWGSAPQWNSEGTAFITSAPPKYVDVDGNAFTNVTDDLPYVSGHELFSVSRDGLVKRLTTLTTTFDADEETYVWSPDERYIAFWLKINQKDSERELAILELATGNVTSLCLSGGDGGDVPNPPVWSPDGKQIIVTPVDTKSFNPDIIIIDIEQKLAVKIVDNAVAVGWMVSEP